MARLFISHSSKDNVSALAFQHWLSANGWTSDDVFVDLHGIGAGERWRDTLRKANAACEAVILLASPEALASVECQKELELAEALGKEIIVAILRDLEKDAPGLARYSERQFVDLSAEPRERMEPLEHEGRLHRVEFNSEALAKIKSRLDELGIAPGSFAWPPKDRPNAEPFPGLAAFGEDDAGIFFGREADIMSALTEIRLVRRRRQPRLIVVQAASGAGKSSFLRAGLWARLKRDPDFAPLAILRPAQGVLSGPDGLGQRIAPFFERHGKLRAPGGIQASILNAEPAKAAAALAALLAEAASLATAARRAAAPEARAPAPLLAIDQAEELFAAENAIESQIFLNALSPLLKDPPPDLDPYVILTIRSDSVQSLLDRVAVLGLDTPKPIYLPPMARESYREVIVRPAEVFSARVRRLSVDPALVQAVVDEAKGADALPLLAFTLGQLYANYRQTGELTRANYDEMGGAAGSIRRALALAQASVGAAGSNEALRRLILPQLATWDPSADQGKGAAKRIVARLAKVFEGDRMVLAPLANALVEQRLLTRGGDTLEVAHEALLRQPPLEGWLAEDRDFLMWRDRLAYARAQYEANSRGLLVGRELQVAREWLSGRPGEDIAIEDREFVSLSVEEDDRRHNEEQVRDRQRQEAELEAARQREHAAAMSASASRRIAQRTRVGIVVSIVLAAFAAWQWSLAQSKAEVAEAAKKRAETGEAGAQRGQSLYLSRLAREDHSKVNVVRSMLRAVEAMPDAKRGVQRPLVREAEEALATSYYQMATQPALTEHATTVTSLTLMPDGKRALTTSHDGTARLWDLATRLPVIRMDGHFGAIAAASVSKDGRWILTGSFDATARVWDAESGRSVQTLAGHTARVTAVTLSSDAKRAFTASADGTLRIWDVASGEQVRSIDTKSKENTRFSLDGNTLPSIVLGPEEKSIFSKGEGIDFRVWDTDTGELRTLPEKTNEAGGSSQILAYSPAGSFMLVKTSASWGAQTRIEVLDARSFAKIARLAYEPSNSLSGETVAISPDGKLVAIGGGSYSSAAVKLYDTKTGRLVRTLTESEKQFAAFVFSPDGGKIFATVGGLFIEGEERLHVWSTATGAKTGIIRTTGSVGQFEVSADNRRVVYEGGGQVHVIEDGAEMGMPSPSMYTTISRSFSFDPQSRYIVSAIDKGPTVVWDIGTLMLRGVLRQTGSQAHATALSNDGAIVAAGAADGLQLFQLDPFRRLAELSLPSVSKLGFNADGSRLIVSTHRSEALIASSGRSSAVETGNLLIATSKFVIAKGGRRLFTADENSAFGHLWDLEAGRIVTTITEKDATLSQAAFDSSGERLVTIGSTGRVRLFDAKSGDDSAEVVPDAKSAAVTPDGGRIVTRIATSSSSSELRVFDSKSGALRFTMAIPENSGAFTYSPDGHWIAFQVDGALRLIDVFAGKETAQLALGVEAQSLGLGGSNIWAQPSNVLFSDDGSRILASAKGGTKIWETGTGRLVCLIDAEDVSYPILNQSGTRVIIYNDLFDGTNGKRIGKLGGDRSRNWFVARGNRIVHEADDGRVTVLDGVTGSRIAELEGLETGPWQLSDQNIAWANGKGVTVYDAVTGQRKFTLDAAYGKGTRLVFSGDTNRLAVIGPDESGHLIDLTTLSSAGVFKCLRNWSRVAVLDSGAVLTVRNGFELSQFDTARLERLAVIPLSEGGGRDFTFSADGLKLAVVGLGNEASIWRLDGLERLTSLRGHEDTINSVEFSRDGRFVVTGSDDGKAIIWNATTGENVRTLSNDHRVEGAAFSADGTTVRARLYREAVRWRIDNGERVDDTEKSGEQAGGTLVSPDGKQTAQFLGGRDTMKLIDATTMETKLSIQLISGSFSNDGESISLSPTSFEAGVMLSPDGRTAMSPKTGVMWRMLWNAQDYVDFAKENVPRCLTLEERREMYLDPEPPAWCIELSKWPYNTPAWRTWLSETRAGNQVKMPVY